MNVYDIVERILKIDEQTTMSSISYLPSTVGAVKTSIFALAKMKSDWNIELVEEETKKNVKFEDALSVSVPNQYWGDFGNNFGISKAGKVSLNRLLKEAMEEDLWNVRNDLKPTLTSFFEHEDFQLLEKQVGIWRSFFGVTSREETKSAVNVESKEKDIQFLTSKLLKVYGNDKGGLELLLSAIEQRKELATFEVFNKFDFLYGTKILSTYRKVNIIYESVIDLNYQFSQSVSIDMRQTEVIAAMEEMTGIKVVKNVIYPEGSIFDRSFYKVLRNTIKDAAD